jgi:hypothetical protein
MIAGIQLTPEQINSQSTASHNTGTAGTIDPTKKRDATDDTHQQATPNSR